MRKRDFKRSMPLGLLVLLIASGCAGLQSLESGQTEKLAVADDRACRDRGYTWPSEAYIECRLDLRNRRARENWHRLEMARSQEAMNPGSLSTHGMNAPFRPVRKENFYCELRPSTRDDIDYIYCGER